MGIVIESPEVVERIERLSSASGKSAQDIVAEAIGSTLPQYGDGAVTGERREAALRAVREAQEYFRLHRDPTDTRSPDDIIGYNDHGLPA